VLPADKVDVFHGNLAKHDRDSLVSWQVYRPKRGEHLGAIAERFGVPVIELKRVNGIAMHSWRVPQLLAVPMGGSASKSIGALPIKYAPPIALQSARPVHVVKRGDTLSAIAARYRVRVADLKRWNRIGEVLQIGQKIHIR
jgi:LysM repeat protein